MYLTNLKHLKTLIDLTNLADFWYLEDVMNLRNVNDLIHVKDLKNLTDLTNMTDTTNLRNLTCIKDLINFTNLENWKICWQIYRFDIYYTFTSWVDLKKLLFSLIEVHKKFIQMVYNLNGSHSFLYVWSLSTGH